MTDRTFWLATLAAAAGAIVLRLVYVFTAVRGRIELFGDAETYHLLGRHVAGGAGYVRPREFADLGVSIPTAEFPPFYPLVLATLDVIGIDQPDDQRIVGALVGGVTVVVVALLGRAVAGALVGAVAAVLFAAYPQMVVFDGSLASEGWYALLIAVTLLCVVRARNDGDGSSGLRWWVAAGAALGIATLTRSEAVVLLPALIVPATFARRGEPIDWATWGRRVGVASIGVIACVGAWTVRNAVALDHLLPFTNNSGTLLAGANCDAVYRGEQTGLWRVDCALAVDITGLDETEAASARRDEAIDFATDNTARVPAVVTLRVLRTFGAWDIRTQLFFESFEGRSYQWLWAGWIGWLVLAPAAIVGWVLARRRRVEVWPLIVPLGVAFALAVVTYGNQRLRVIAEPSVVVLAAIAVATGIESWRQSWRRGQRQAPTGSS